MLAHSVPDAQLPTHWPLYHGQSQWPDLRVAQLLNAGLASETAQRTGLELLAEALCSAWVQAGGPPDAVRWLPFA